MEFEECAKMAGFYLAGNNDVTFCKQYIMISHKLNISQS